MRPETVKLLDDVDLSDIFADEDLSDVCNVKLSDGRSFDFRGMITFEPEEASMGSTGGYGRAALLVYPAKDCPELAPGAELRCRGYRYDVREVAAGSAGVARARLRRLRGPNDAL